MTLIDLFHASGDPPEELLPRDGSMRLWRGFLPAREADNSYAALMDEITWVQEEAVMMGRRVPVPRLNAWAGDVAYRYSGITHRPGGWTPALEAMRAHVSGVTGTPFNACLLNFYRDGRDHVSWHADNEAGIGPVIASVSLGAVRRFRVRHRATGHSFGIDLPHGSLLVMGGGMQRHWQHCLTRTAKPVAPRINLTFRTVSQA